MFSDKTLEDIANKSPNDNLNKRRLKAIEEGDEAKYAFLTEYLGFPVEGDHYYEIGRRLLEESPEKIVKLEHEVNFVIYGKKYSEYLAEQSEQEE